MQMLTWVVDNATESLKTSSQMQAPSLHMAVHDPALSVMDALHMGYTRLVLINANANNAINLGLRVRQAVGLKPAYDYGSSWIILSRLYIEIQANEAWLKDLTITSIPNLDLVCNTGAPKSYPCHVTLFLQFPTFERTILLQKMVMSWLVSGFAVVIFFGLQLMFSL